ncbi:MAG: hypothetical protein HY825_08730 [Acidobacteria bacterium]|nr:hypothetical protein [Acidobacteriota bacterium]
MMTPSRRAGIIVVLYAFCMIYLVPVYPHYPSANDVSRWVTVASLVERGTFETSWTEPLVGPLVDASRLGDDIYSNKAPGLALLALPGYLVVRPFLGAPDAANLRWSMYAMRLAAVTLPGVLLGLLVLRRTGGDAMAAATLLFATPVFVYGALLFSHVTVAACLYGAYALLFPRPSAASTCRRDALAGALCGLATITDYQAGPIAVLLGAFLLRDTTRWRRLGSFVAGGLPFALALGAYDLVLFGSPFSLSAANEVWADTTAVRSQGLFGIGAPRADSAWTLLLSPARGLFFYSPVLALGAFALAPRRGPEAARMWCRLSVVALVVLPMLGYPESHGGWCVGARYLLPIVPFLVEAAQERLRRPGFVFGLLLVSSVVLSVLPVLTFPFPPPAIATVHASLTWPFLVAGFATPNLGSWITPGVLSLLPIVAAVATALFLALAGGGRRALAGAAGGALLAAGVVLAPVHDTFTTQAFRALLLDTHFVPAARLERLAAETNDPQLRAQLEELAALSDGTRQLAPDGWPYR